MSTIENAVHSDTEESLEQYVVRAITKIFERTPKETSLRIVRATNLKLNVCGEAGVYSSESSELQSGLEIGMRFDFSAEQEDSYKCSVQCVAEHGFVVESPKDGSLHTEPCDMSKLNPDLVAGLVCCILRRGWGITTKNEIVCYFDHEEDVLNRNLTSADDLRDSLAELLSYEPYDSILSILDKRDDSILALRREGHGSVGFEVGSSERDKKGWAKRLVGVLETSGYVQDIEFGEGFWRGPDDSPRLTSILCNILRTGGMNLESGKLSMRLNVKRRFI
jgi:hypothetical protein